MGSQVHRTQIAEKRRRELLKLVSGLNLLPSTYAVPMRILELHRSGTASMEDMATAISADPGLVAKVLALVNSAAFGGSGKITRLSQALTRIGMKNLLPLIFGFSLGGIFNKLSMPAAERSSLWKSSLLKAVTARELAATLTPELTEEAFVCGLLQDVAVPAMYAVDRSTWPETAAILQLDNDEERYERECRVYGIDHAELGGIILTTMGLPVMFRAAVTKQHCGAAALQAVGNTPLAKALDIAASVPHRIAQPNPQIMRTLALRVRAAMRSDDPEAATALLKRIVSKFTTMLAAFGEADEASVAFKGFLQSLGQEISLAMESAVGHSTTEITNLKAREAELLEKVTSLQEHADQSDFDSLTRLLNRRGFFPRAKRLLALAREYEWPCAIAFVDLNDLKIVNDTHGHAAGDAMLASAAGRIAEAMCGRGISSRIGGDEFAMLVAARDVATVREDVERISRSLAAFTIVNGDVQITGGASMGVQVIELPSEACDIDALLKRADEAMYKQKRASKVRAAARDAGQAAA